MASYGLISNLSEKQIIHSIDYVMKSSNTAAKIIGLILIVVGLALIYWGYTDSGAVGAKVTKTFSGSEPDTVMFKYIGGAVAFVVGIFLVVKK